MITSNMSVNHMYGSTLKVSLGSSSSYSSKILVYCDGSQSSQNFSGHGLESGVHLLRNAKKHLHYRTFREYIQSIKNSLSYEEGSRLFDALMKRLPREVDFVERVANRKEHYLAFLKYPKELRSLFLFHKLG